MTDTINILETFLSNFSPEVEGRMRGELDDAICQKLFQLSQGELAGESRIETIREVMVNPTAMDWLLNCLKSQED